MVFYYSNRKVTNTNSKGRLSGKGTPVKWLPACIRPLCYNGVPGAGKYTEKGSLLSSRFHLLAFQLQFYYIYLFCLFVCAYVYVRMCRHEYAVVRERRGSEDKLLESAFSLHQGSQGWNSGCQTGPPVTLPTEISLACSPRL